MAIYSKTTYSKENFIFAIIVRNVKAPCVISRKFSSLSVEYEAESKDESISEDLVKEARKGF